MNRSRFIGIFCMLIAVLMLICACDFANGDETSAQSVSENTIVTTSETTEETAEETTEANTKVTYKITVTDADGNPLAGATVQLCVGDMCLLPSPTDANGVAIFELDEAEYSVKATLKGYVSEEYYEFPDGSTELTVALTKAD